MKIIVAINNDNAIGNEGELLYHVKEDMKRFKKITTESGIVLMGRKTFESLGRDTGLSNRENWILSRDENFVNTYNNKSSNIKCFLNKNEVLRYIIKRTKDEMNIHFLNKICVIGGESIYKQFLPQCTEMWLTRYNTSGEKADSYFKFDENQWLSTQHEVYTDPDTHLEMRFEHLRRIDSVLN